MARRLRLALVLTLLAATTVAFVVTERLKLEPAAITDTRVLPKEIAPECDCVTLDATVSFRLRRRDTLTVQMVDAKKDVVRTLALRRPLAPGKHSFIWDGRDDAGAIVPDGSYTPRVELARERRTFNLPNPIRVDTKPPTIRLASAAPRTISPDDDGRADRVSVTYRQSERGHAILFINGKLRVRSKSGKTQGKLDWYGKVRRRPVDPGTYELTLSTRDLAGNVAVRPAVVTIHVRYIELMRRVIRVRAGGRLVVGVSTDARRFRWKLGRRTGTASPPRLVLRAPDLPGLYRLVVEERNHRATARVYVQRT